MKNFTYFMPTKIIFGKNCIVDNSSVFKDMGKKAYIITGKHSAKLNGSENDVKTALEKEGIEYIIFDKIEENPDIETIFAAAQKGISEKVDFVIGIGGGSPMDSAKAISCLILNNEGEPKDILFGEQKKHLPVIEVPTTAGTGSETTPFSIVTLHNEKTKSSIAQKIFAKYAFLDAKYMENLPVGITNNTAIDSLSHLIESYMSTNSNFLSEKIAEVGLNVFKDCIPYLINRQYPFEIREKLLIASTIAGILISQSGTSIPHFLGYQLTYDKGIPHGMANGILMKAYLELFGENKKVDNICNILGFNNLYELGDFHNEVLDIKEKFTYDDIKAYSGRSFGNKAKLKTFPRNLSFNDILNIYSKSLL